MWIAIGVIAVILLMIGVLLRPAAPGRPTTDRCPRTWRRRCCSARTPPEPPSRSPADDDDDEPRPMSVRAAVVFPGQGTQTPGDGRGVAGPTRVGGGGRAGPKSRSVSRSAGSSLDADADELLRTRNAQLAVLLTSLLAWEAVCDRVVPVAFAGHSLGQVTALIASGVMPFDDGVRFAAVRADRTQAAADATPGGDGGAPRRHARTGRGRAGRERRVLDRERQRTGPGGARGHARRARRRASPPRRPPGPAPPSRSPWAARSTRRSCSRPPTRCADDLVSVTLDRTVGPGRLERRR